MGNPRAILFAVALLTWTTSAGAQTQDRRNVELAVGVGGAASWWVPGTGVAGGELRITAPMSDRKAIEGLGGVSALKVDGSTIGFYGVQMRQRLGHPSDGEVRPFISYGVIGVVVHSRTSEFSVRRADGSISVTPGRSQTFATPPFIGLIGGGTERRLTPRLNGRLEVQAVMALVVPIAVRVSAGVSMGLGKSR